jgi:transposase
LLPQSVISPAIAIGTAGQGAELGDLLPHLRGVIVDKIECMPGSVLFSARYWPAEAACPACGIRSARGHSSYVRLLRDLPLSGRPVLIHLAMRRFLCPNAACKRVTFAGQADGLTARYQRWSVPLAGLLSQVALELAGRAGTRLAAALGIAVHRGTLLRLVIDLPDPELSTAPQVVGADDFALRKGHVYATILAETHDRGRRQTRNLIVHSERQACPLRAITRSSGVLRRPGHAARVGASMVTVGHQASFAERDGDPEVAAARRRGAARSPGASAQPSPDE